MDLVQLGIVVVEQMALGLEAVLLRCVQVDEEVGNPIAVPALSLALARETDASVRTELHAVRTLLAWEVLKRDQVPPS